MWGTGERRAVVPLSKASKKGRKRNENECSAVWCAGCMNRKLCAGAEQCPELSHEASKMTEVYLTEGSQRHTCRNGKD